MITEVLLHNFSFHQSVVPVHVYATILVDVISETEMDVEIYFSVRNVCWSLIHSTILVATNQKTGEISETLSPKREGSGLSINVTNGTDGILLNNHYSITLELINNAGKIDINGSLSKYTIVITVVTVILCNVITILIFSCGVHPLWTHSFVNV